MLILSEGSTRDATDHGGPPPNFAATLGASVLQRKTPTPLLDNITMAPAQPELKKVGLHIAMVTESGAARLFFSFFFQYVFDGNRAWLTRCNSTSTRGCSSNSMAAARSLVSSVDTMSVALLLGFRIDVDKWARSF